MNIKKSLTNGTVTISYTPNKKEVEILEYLLIMKAIQFYKGGDNVHDFLIEDCTDLVNNKFVEIAQHTIRTEAKLDFNGMYYLEQTI
jgi:GTP cyclohydrolase III